VKLAAPTSAIAANQRRAVAVYLDRVIEGLREYAAQRPPR